jgi:hypothetical protein
MRSASHSITLYVTVFTFLSTKLAAAPVRDPDVRTLGRGLHVFRATSVLLRASRRFQKYLPVLIASVQFNRVIQLDSYSHYPAGKKPGLVPELGTWRFIWGVQGHVHPQIGHDDRDSGETSRNYDVEHMP